MTVGRAAATLFATAVCATVLTACGTPQSTTPREPAEDAAMTTTPIDIRSVWDFSDTPGTRAAFVALLDDPRAEDADVRAELLTQIARTHGLEGDFEAAHARLAEAAAIMPSGGRAEVRHALELGRVHNSSADRAGAMPHFHLAVDRAVAHGGVSGLHVDALHMLGIAAPSEEALDWNLQALEVARSSDDPAARRWLGSLLNNIAWTYFDLGAYEQALALHREGLQWRLDEGQSGAPVWIAEWSIARMLRALERYDEALAIQRRIRDEREAAGQPGGYVFEELGELALQRGDDAAARAHFAEAWALLSQDAWMMENEAERMARIRELAGAE